MAGRRKSRASFESDLRKGDILISTSQQSSTSAMIGHAAIMATDDWVIEMPGENQGSSSSSSFSGSFSSSFSFASVALCGRIRAGNNRRISKQKWYTVHLSDDIKVYRCPNSDVAEDAADWAYTHYYNSSGGDDQTIHVQYSVVSPYFQVRDPSYCSKLVLQSYFYGPTNGPVILPTVILLPIPTPIVPTTIPSYFLSSYRLSVVGLY